MVVTTGTSFVALTFTVFVATLLRLLVGSPSSTWNSTVRSCVSGVSSVVRKPTLRMNAWYCAVVPVPLIVSTPVPGSYEPVTGPWSVNVSSSWARNVPPAIVTVPPTRFALSVSVTVASLSSCVAAAFSA